MLKKCDITKSKVFLNALSEHMDPQVGTRAEDGAKVTQRGGTPKGPKGDGGSRPERQNQQLQLYYVFGAKSCFPNKQGSLLLRRVDKTTEHIAKG